MSPHRLFSLYETFKKTQVTGSVNPQELQLQFIGSPPFPRIETRVCQLVVLPRWSPGKMPAVARGCRDSSPQICSDPPPPTARGQMPPGVPANAVCKSPGGLPVPYITRTSCCRVNAAQLHAACADEEITSFGLPPRGYHASIKPAVSRVFVAPVSSTDTLNSAPRLIARVLGVRIKNRNLGVLKLAIRSLLALFEPGACGDVRILR